MFLSQQPHVRNLSLRLFGFLGFARSSAARPAPGDTYVFTALSLTFRNRLLVGSRFRRSRLTACLLGLHFLSRRPAPDWLGSLLLRFGNRRYFDMRNCLFLMLCFALRTAFGLILRFGPGFSAAAMPATASPAPGTTFLIPALGAFRLNFFLLDRRRSLFFCDNYRLTSGLRTFTSATSATSAPAPGTAFFVTSFGGTFYEFGSDFGFKFMGWSFGLTSFSFGALSLGFRSSPAATASSAPVARRGVSFFGLRLLRRDFNGLFLSDLDRPLLNYGSGPFFSRTPGSTSSLRTFRALGTRFFGDDLGRGRVLASRNGSTWAAAFSASLAAHLTRTQDAFPSLRLLFDLYTITFAGVHLGAAERHILSVGLGLTYYSGFFNSYCVVNDYSVAHIELCPGFPVLS